MEMLEFLKEILFLENYMSNRWKLLVLGVALLMVGLDARSFLQKDFAPILVSLFCVSLAFSLTRIGLSDCFARAKGEIAIFLAIYWTGYGLGISLVHLFFG